MFGLADLIAPLSKRSFVEEYQGRKAIYIPGEPGKFSQLYDWEDINHVLNHGRPSLEGVRLVYEKQSLPQSALGEAAEWLTKGATLVINSVDQIDPIVSHFSAELGRDVNRHVNINCYASCPAKQGFDNHYDRHDVFIVATAGRKAWKVFEPTYAFPLERQTFKKGAAPDIDPYLECEMSPGDVLYIPRGHWHYAVAVTPSVHLTVGPHSCSGIDFLSWLTDELMAHDEFLRRDFPIVDTEAFGGAQPDDEFDAHLDAFSRRMCDIFSARDELKELFVRYGLVSMKPRRTYRLPDMALLRERIAPETAFDIAAPQKAVINYDPETRAATVYLRGHVLELENISAAVLETLFNSTHPLSGSALMAVDDGLEWDQLRSFLLLLFDRGVITPSERQPAPVASDSARQPRR